MEIFETVELFVFQSVLSKDTLSSFLFYFAIDNRNASKLVEASELAVNVESWEL